MPGSTTAQRRPLADIAPPDARTRVAGATPTTPTTAAGPHPSRPPESRPSWEDAVYAGGRALPAGRKISGSVYVAVLLRWARYASWSGGRPGIEGRVGVNTLAADVGVSEKTIDRVFALAVELGHLTRTAGRQGGLNPRAATYAARVPVIELVEPAQTGPLGVPPGLIHMPSHAGPLGVPSALVLAESDGTPERVRRDPGASQTGPPEVPRPPRPQDLHHPRAREAIASPLVQVLDGGGGAEEDRTKAAVVVDELAVVLRLGDLDRAQLVPALATVLAAGKWPPDALIRELSRDLPGTVRSGRRLVLHRLANLPPPPTTPPAVAASPWCKEPTCHPVTRQREDPVTRDPAGPCPVCHYSRVAAVGA